MTPKTEEHLRRTRNNPTLVRALTNCGMTSEFHIFAYLASDAFRTDEEDADMQELRLLLRPPMSDEEFNDFVAPRQSGSEAGHD